MYTMYIYISTFHIQIAIYNMQIYAIWKVKTIVPIQLISFHLAQSSKARELNKITVYWRSS